MMSARTAAAGRQTQSEKHAAFRSGVFERPARVLRGARLQLRAAVDVTTTRSGRGQSGRQKPPRRLWARPRVQTGGWWRVAPRGTALNSPGKENRASGANCRRNTDVRFRETTYPGKWSRQCMTIRNRRGLLWPQASDRCRCALQPSVCAWPPRHRRSHARSVHGGKRRDERSRSVRVVTVFGAVRRRRRARATTSCWLVIRCSRGVDVRDRPRAVDVLGTGHHCPETSLKLNTAETKSRSAPASLVPSTFLAT